MNALFRSEAVAGAGDKTRKRVNAYIAKTARVDAARELATGLKRLGAIDDEQAERFVELHRTVSERPAREAVARGIVTESDLRAAYAIRSGLAAPADGAGRLPRGLVMVTRAKSREAERFRVIRATLSTLRSAADLDAFAVTDSGDGGVSAYVAMNIAASFAQVGARTLLVDADLRKARLTRMFRLGDGATLEGALAGICDAADAVRPTMAVNLSFVGATAAPSSIAGERLSQQKFGAILDEYRAGFDRVVICCAPPMSGAETRFVWAAAKNVVVAVRRHQDRLPALKKLHADLRQVGADSVGVILAG